MFASSSLVEHLARGVVGICALSYAISISAQHSVYSLALAGVSLLAFRGCPICWTIGFVETTFALAIQNLACQPFSGRISLSNWRREYEDQNQARAAADVRNGR
jgi:hypothetical protein